MDYFFNKLPPSGKLQVSRKKASNAYQSSKIETSRFSSMKLILEHANYSTNGTLIGIDRDEEKKGF